MVILSFMILYCVLIESCRSRPVYHVAMSRRHVLAAHRVSGSRRHVNSRCIASISRHLNISWRLKISRHRQFSLYLSISPCRQYLAASSILAMLSVLAIPSVSHRIINISPHRQYSHPGHSRISCIASLPPLSANHSTPFASKRKQSGGAMVIPWLRITSPHRNIAGYR
jgi:hypothetical protein